MSLRAIFKEMYAIVEGATEHLPWAETSRRLEGGADITVKAEGRRRQVIIARLGAPVGLIETTTFQAHGQIPDHAEGVCWFPTRKGLYRVTFTWEELPPAPTLFDLPLAETPAPAEPEPYRLPEVADLPEHL